MPTSRKVRLAWLLGLLVLAFALSAAPALAAGNGILSVSKVGNGYVSGDGGDIDCGSDCSALVPEECEYIAGEGLVCTPGAASLTAVNANGFAFDHWEDCSAAASATCSVMVPGEANVTAYFNDVQDPTVAITAPLGSAPRTGTITISATAADNAGVARVEFYVRGEKVGQDTSAPYSLQFNTASVSDGMATISVRSIDTSGRSSAGSGNSLILDNTDPTLGVTGPNQSFHPAASTQGWALSAADPASGIASVQCKVDGGSLGPCSDGNTQHVVSDAAEGEHTLIVRATDGVGRYTEVTRTWTIDGTAPVVSIVSGTADGAVVPDGAVTYDIGATEAGPIECSIAAAGQPAAFGDCSGSDSHSAGGFAPGSYVFAVRGYDAAGNQSAVVQRTFTVPAPADGSASGSTGGGTGTGGSGGGTGTTNGGETTGGANGGGPLADTVAPALTVPASIKAKRRSVVAKGLVYVAGCSEACTLSAKLVLDARTAKRLRLASKRALGTAAVKITTAGKGKVVVKPSKAARRALSRARTVRLRLVTTAVDAAGNSVSKTSKVTLR